MMGSFIFPQQDSSSTLSEFVLSLQTTMSVCLSVGRTEVTENAKSAPSSPKLPKTPLNHPPTGQSAGRPLTFFALLGTPDEVYALYAAFLF